MNIKSEIVDIVDSKTGEVLEGIEIPCDKFKRGYLEVPDSFVGLVDSQLEKEPLFFRDSEGNRYIVDLYPRKCLLSGLGEWYRLYNPTPEDSILIHALNADEGLFLISLKSEQQGESVEATPGLFLGKKYSMVGGRKYELSANYYLPLSDLLTHIFICGVTGSGKTVLGKALIEEAALKGIPAILIDLKGDLSSLGFLFSSLSAEEFEDWVDAKDKQERTSLAKREAEKHELGLSRFGISKEKIAHLKEQTEIKIFTPRLNKGIPLALSAPLGTPDNPIQLYKEDRETFNGLVASLTDAFLDRMYPGVKRTKIENERNFLYEIVHYAWLHEVNLDGEEGMHRLLRLVEEPPFKEIGGLPVKQYIYAENRWARLLNKINTLISGADRMWFEGHPLNMELLLGKENDKTLVSIINLTELDHFEDRSFVVAQVAFKIYQWMRKLSGTTRPRLLFFIDEIGGGGGKQALFPSYPYSCAAKWGLNYLLRQGRSFGVCCAFSTQNPGDVDYKGLSNCGTWMVGKLATDRDHQKILEGMAIWGSDAEQVKRNLVAADVGDFIVKNPHGDVSYIKERWLMSYHRVLTLNEVSKLCESKS